MKQKPDEPKPKKAWLAEQTVKAREMDNEFDCDVYGRFPWIRSERNGKNLTLSKTGLGDFVYAVLSHGGDVTGFFAMYPKIRHSAVFASVRLTIAAKEAIEAETPYRFDVPPVLSVSPQAEQRRERKRLAKKKADGNTAPVSENREGSVGG